MAWPTAAAVEIDAVAVDAKFADVGGLAVDVSRAEGLSGAVSRSAQGTPQRARVQVFDRPVSKRLGVDGPVLQVSRADGVGAVGQVSLSVRYAGFEHAIGGDWGARLRLVKLPACALTSPERAECRRATPLASVNDTSARTVTAEVDAAAGAAGATVLAMSAGASSTQGDYAATKLAPSSSWSTALASGGFSWSYPIEVPAVPGGLQPQVGLSYSSQAVDGRTSMTNNQGSWIGEGFTYEPGYIERRYKPCADDGHENAADQCWAFHNATIMLGGRSGTLVKVNDNLWKLSSDDGSKIERLTGAVNGDDDGEHWRVTTTDGTQYYFGKNRLPGWSANMEETESVWTVPVFGDDSGEPCNKSSGFDDSYCDQAWRWNLDYVVNPRGSVISYYYDREVNYYARGARITIDGAKYHRGGYLARIDYGQRDQQVYSTKAPARVVFGTVERCIPAAGVDCDAEDLNEDTAASWPDVPEDLICAAGTHCEIGQASASFFTRKRLVKIQTEISNGTSWTPVASWALEHAFKVNDDASRTLWLKKITKSGHRDGVTLTMPATELDGIQLPNRIDLDDDDFGPLIRYRLATVKTDTGAQITIKYKAPDCAKDNLPDPETSTRRCYPIIWNPLGGGEDDEVTDWFHKYVVDNVVVDDLLGGSNNLDMVSAYEYVGDAAWRKGEPDGITKNEDLSWNNWRGYAKVIVRTGDGQSMPGRADHYFLRGLSGGEKADGSKPTVTVTDSAGTSYTDHDEWSGHELETVLYNGADIVTKTINQPWRHVTRTQTETWGSNISAFVRTDVVRNFTAMPADGQGNPVWRETRTETEYDPTWGRPVAVDDLGETGAGKSGDDRCTRTYYRDNPTTYLYSYANRTQTVSVNCDVANPNLATQLISATRTSYDLKAWDEAPTKGVVTRSENLHHFDGTNIVYTTASEVTDVDDFGRPEAMKDALGHTTTTQYVDVNGLAAQIATTRALPNFSTTTVVDPATGQPLYLIDVNGKRTDLAYDALGRLTDVWLPNRSKAAGATPNRKFGYQVRNDKTSVVSTYTIRNDGTYQVGYELYDGLLRPRQKQMPGPGGWLLTDTFHDGNGQAYKSNDVYLATGVAGDIPLVTAEGAVNGQHTFTFDGVGRAILDTFSIAGDEKWSASTTYAGDRTHVDPPVGGVPTTTVWDARGQMTELHQYHGESPTGPADVTEYTYTPAGQLATLTDPQDNVWRYHYNQRQLQETIENPDSGDTRYVYDDAGQVTSVTDGRDVKVSYRYDALGRKTETWQGELDSGLQLSAWVYDAPGNLGELYYSRRIHQGQSYYTIYLTRDELYRPTKTRYSFPSAAAGVGSLLGKNYDYSAAYNTDGTLQSFGVPAAGGLPAEALAATYDNLLRPTALTGATTYVTSTLYSNVGELLQTELYTGSGKKAWLTWHYERGTGRLSRTKINRQNVPVYDMDAQYTYDESGNVLSIADLPVGGTRDIQCFEYDYLNRITAAWSTASSTKTCADGVTQTGVGGPAPYHHSWTFDKVGNRETETIHSLTGGTDTERTYVYPAQGEGQNRPHSLTRVDETGPDGDRTFRYDYDAGGNTICRPNTTTTTNDCTIGSQVAQQSLTWDAEGHLASSTPTGGQPTTYIYNAEGTRIARKDPGGNTTLFLPGMELTQTGTVVTGTRSYGFGGHTVAVRNSTGIYFQGADHHGTASASIKAGDGAISWRRTTPYGTSRQPTAPAFWPDRKGFLGAEEDPTGLTHLGAREYDPRLGRFISVDPLLNPAEPQQWHGYAYASNSPIIKSDATGLVEKQADDMNYPDTTGTSINTIVLDNGTELTIIRENTDFTYCIDGYCLLNQDVHDPFRLAKEYDKAKARWLKSRKDGGGNRELSDLEILIVLETACNNANMGGAQGCSQAMIMEVGSQSAALAQMEMGNESGWLQWAAIVISMLPTGGWGSTGCRGFGRNPVVRTAGRGYSFSADTEVLLADGSSKPIKDLVAGDRVLATDPETGETRAETVTVHHINTDDMLTDLTVQDGADRHVINTTWDHPFWSQTRESWVDAAELAPGEQLRSRDGDIVTVAEVHNHIGPEVMYNLTVDDLHTYYVLVGDEAVLVHNNPGPAPVPDFIQDAIQLIENGSQPQRVDQHGNLDFYKGKDAPKGVKAYWYNAEIYEVPGLPPGTENDWRVIRTKKNGQWTYGWVAPTGWPKAGSKGAGHNYQRIYSYGAFKPPVGGGAGGAGCNTAGVNTPGGTP
ncbi:polymorphic toxin-type HINT domain-containing protein [Catellatospora coxensis]|uniref:polymorphic toxin-type HINT domain-containing protein n=1 Tax=Catellatospora coxensis TaxID=310354 RepID=UPI0019420282|nr:polymorphic toxin-type HINT domain-containing protein [Catellatospora coxensis]